MCGALILNAHFGIDGIVFQVYRPGLFINLHPDELMPLLARSSVANRILTQHHVSRLSADANARNLSFKAIILDYIFFELIAVTGHAKALIPEVNALLVIAPNLV